MLASSRGYQWETMPDGTSVGINFNVVKKE